MARMREQLSEERRRKATYQRRSPAASEACSLLHRSTLSGAGEGGQANTGAATCAMRPTAASSRSMASGSSTAFELRPFASPLGMLLVGASSVRAASRGSEEQGVRGERRGRLRRSSCGQPAGRRAHLPVCASFRRSLRPCRVPTSPEFVSPPPKQRRRAHSSSARDRPPRGPCARFAAYAAHTHAPTPPFIRTRRPPRPSRRG